MHLRISGNSTATDVVMLEPNSLKIQLILGLPIPRKRTRGGYSKLGLPSAVKSLWSPAVLSVLTLSITRSVHHRVCYDVFWL